jgi:hypothetical protein
MSPPEVVAISVLWIVLLGLAGLVLVLYRQLDKAYRSAEESDVAALLPGVEAPEIEILGEDGIEPLAFPAPGEIGLMAFVSTTCDACHNLLQALGRESLGVTWRMGLVNGEDTREYKRGWDGVDLEWLAHPPDVVRSYGVTQVPYVYAVKGKTILASGAAAGRGGLERLLEEARERASSAGADGGTNGHPAPVTAGGAG